MNLKIPHKLSVTIGHVIGMLLVYIIDGYVNAIKIGIRTILILGTIILMVY
jgi:hypothetical protein